MAVKLERAKLVGLFPHFVVKTVRDVSSFVFEDSLMHYSRFHSSFLEPLSSASVTHWVEINHQGLFKIR